MLTVAAVHKWYGNTKAPVLSGVTLTLEPGTCMGLVGESGAGKTTLARLILGLDSPSRGRILMEGKPVRAWQRQHPGQMSVIFQDYTTSVSPRYTVADAIAEPLKALNRFKEAPGLIPRLLERVGLPATLMAAYPHQLSGGQLQRVCIARALAARPRFIVFDEALGSLDLPVQSRILDLLSDLVREFGLTSLFITHDLMAATAICDRISFLYRGKIVEQVDTPDLPGVQHPYAEKLLASAAFFASPSHWSCSRLPHP